MTIERAERLERPRSAAMDELLGVQFGVLDDGFIRVVDYMGTDESIVQAARVSYGKGTKKVSEDRGLIRYLMRHWHTTPFEMCELKLHVRVPMDAWRQWIRHRTASVNEYSTRYSEAIDARQETAPDQWRSQSRKNKQGSAGLVNLETLPDWKSRLHTSAPAMGEHPGPGEYLTAREKELHEHAQEVYQERLKFDVAREQARKDLPLSTYTEAYWKVDLHNLLGFLRLRMDSHAQKEIRAYADVIGHDIVSAWVPHTWEAFEDYRLGATSLTRLEAEQARLLLAGMHDSAALCARQNGWTERGKNGKLKRNRERDECAAKLEALGLSAPWGDKLPLP